MATHTNRTKSIFLSQSALERKKISFPSHAFETEDGEEVSLSMISFQMPKSPLNPVNKINGTFYWYSPSTGVHRAVTIPEAKYASSTTLAAAIKLQLLEIFNTGADCTVSSTTGALTFTVPAKLKDTTTNVDPDGYFVTYNVKSNLLFLGGTPLGAFTDTHLLLGLKATTDDLTPLNACSSEVVVGAGAHTAFTPPRLHTLNEIYVRASLQTDAYMTKDFDRYQDTPGLDIIYSNILGKVEFDGESVATTIAFNEHQSLFDVQLTSTLSQIEIVLTDSRGRPLSSYLTAYEDVPENVPVTIVLQWKAVASRASINGQAVHATPSSRGLPHRSV